MSAETPPLSAEYSVSSEDASLLKRLIGGIQDDEELKQHLLQIRSEAYAAQPYMCINAFEFARLRIAKHPAYKYVLKLGKERKDAIFLELPCCVGGDSRLAIMDGYPRENVITSDIVADYWPIGHKLFKTTPETYPVPFLPGDIFDPNFLRPGVPPLPTTAEITDSPPLKSLTSLTPLQHHVSIIYASLFFHLFEKEKQAQLAHLFASLLSPVPGSIIFGYHSGASDTEEDKNGRSRITGRGYATFDNSPATWKELWTGADGPFTPDQITFETIARQTALVIKGADPKHYFHVWSITRV